MKRHRHNHHNHPRPLALVALAVIALAAIVGLAYDKKRMKHKGVSMLPDFRLTSPAFGSGEAIPAKYTCKGANVSPPLSISGTPQNAASLALMVHDPDAPGGDFLHWCVWNIHPDITSIAENKAPAGATQGANDFGKTGYGGPCPPSGTHRYEFDLYALDSELGLPAGAPRADALAAVRAHALGKTRLTGTFSAG